MTKEQINYFIEFAYRIVSIAEQQEIKCDTFTNWINASGSQWCAIWRSSQTFENRKSFNVKMMSIKNSWHFVEVNFWSNQITFDYTMTEQEIDEFINDLDVRIDFESSKKENINYQIAELQKQIESLKKQLI